MATRLLLTLRPRQWVKNGFVLAPLIFSQRLLDPDSVWRAGAAVAIFIALSGAVYILNDILDRDRDRLHPRKRDRALASGQVKPGEAAAFGSALVAAAVTAAVALGPGLTAATLAYGALMLAYSLSLKHRPIVDVLSIALGFLLRVAGGAAAIGVPLSPWMASTTFALALFLAFHKRRHELEAPDGGGVAHRPVLDAYSAPLLDRAIAVAAALTLASYGLWAATHPLGPALLATLPFVAYGLHRYDYLARRRDLGGHPEEVLTADRPFFLALLGWLVIVLVLLYIAPALAR